MYEYFSLFPPPDVESINVTSSQFFDPYYTKHKNLCYQPDLKLPMRVALGSYFQLQH